jgi:hypothetical protein
MQPHPAGHHRPSPLPVPRGIGRHARVRRYGPRGPVQPHPVTGDAGHARIGRGIGWWYVPTAMVRPPTQPRPAGRRRPPTLPVCRGIGRSSRIRRYGPIGRPIPRPVTGGAGHVPIGRWYVPAAIVRPPTHPGRPAPRGAGRKQSRCATGFAFPIHARYNCVTVDARQAVNQ